MVSVLEGGFFFAPLEDYKVYLSTDSEIRRALTGMSSLLLTA